MTEQAGGRDAFEVLLAVQGFDTDMSQLRHRRETLQQRAELAELDAERDRLRAQERELAPQLDELLARRRSLEKRVETADDRRRAVEQRMYAARGLPARELEAMDGEVAHLRQLGRELEDEELEIMEAEEPLERELGPLRERLGTIAERSEELGESLRAEEAVLDEQLDALALQRRSAAAALPAPLAERYEQLRQRLGGTGAAALVGDRCGGCHLSLPSMEVERIRRLPPDEVVTCEQCGRILVRTS